MEQEIKYVCIKSYNYKMEDLMKYYKNFFEIIKQCKKEYDEYEIDNDENRITRDKLISYSRLEILKHDTMCRFFLDIENLNDNVEYININDKYKYPKFLEDFENYMGFEHQSFTLTLNNNSEHEGLSYHVIWPYVIQFSKIKQYIIDFINQNPQYVLYIDSSIYSNRRIFRCPYQHKPALKRNGRRINDYHKIIFSRRISDIDNNLDFCISNSIIQNIDGLPEINKSINISYDEIDKYNLLYKNTKKKESDQLKPKIEEDKEPLEYPQNNATNTSNNILDILKNSGIDINNSQEILNIISQLINTTQSK